ncbi:extracellular solute-binding protein [Paenibacillus sp. MBLB4367]|uniref:extracellular solute-binding protein n=1 Tax=Paenibacillus sp. MBLB4367 TaxID=3384767 RepID=UPI0039080951
MNRHRPSTRRAAARFAPVLTLTLTLPLSLLTTACFGGAAPAPSPSGTGNKALIKFVAAEYSTATKPYMEKLVREFESQYPDIRVELQVINWDILEMMYNSMISKNQPPDLLTVNTYIQYTKDGMLNDMNGMLSPQLKAKLYPFFMETDNLNGVQYAIPYVASVRNLYYNKDIFDEAGLTEPPATWLELETAAQRIKYTKKADGFGVDLTDNESQAYLSYFFFGAGGGWMKDGKWAINSPENIEGLTFLKKLYDNWLTDPEPTVTTRDEKHRILGNGKLGMMISGNYFTSVVPREFPGLKYGVGPLPVKDGQKPISFGVHDMLLSFKTDHTNKEAISKFLDFFYDDARYEEFTTREGFVPATKTVGDKASSRSKQMKAFMDELQVAKFYPLREEAWPAVMDATRKLGEAVLLGQMSPTEALNQLQQVAVSKSGK